ncbi:MAG: four helix bundle protein [Stygiobacter sp.]|nr:MAG: four helix bundle protein [Stygiobacter sp.]
MESKPIRSVKYLKIYNLSFELALKKFEITKKFPKEELYSLTDQIRRSSRSVTANISEGFAKRKYEHVFIRYLVDAIGSNEETKTWLSFAKDFTYLSLDNYEILDSQYSELGAMIYKLTNSWKNFAK